MLPVSDNPPIRRLKDLFLERTPGFSTFRDKPSAYWANERAYKEEFASLCRNSLTPDLFRGPTSPAAAEEVVSVTRRLLEQRLTSIQGAQNIIGWRYRYFLRTMTADERQVFARAFGDLLFGEGEDLARVETFTRSMWPVWLRTEGKKLYALTRVFPTTFLTAFKPKEHLPLRSDMLDTATREILGKKLIENRPLDAEQYGNVLEFSRGVFNVLQLWGWLPQDLLDVHSFLWVVTSSGYEESAGEQTSGPAH